jgi:hypothetical protein
VIKGKNTPMAQAFLCGAVKYRPAKNASKARCEQGVSSIELHPWLPRKPELLCPGHQPFFDEALERFF